MWTVVGLLYRQGRQGTSLTDRLHVLEMTTNDPGPGGGHSTFFQVGVCGPDFRSVGLANWHMPLKRGACERKISKFGGLWAENFQIWVKIEAVQAKISKFSESKGGLVNWLFCLKWDPCERQERREKGVFRAAHPHTPFLGQCPPGPGPYFHQKFLDQLSHRLI